MTDGNSDSRSATGAALGAKLDGTWLFTIGLGEDVNVNLLRRLASSRGDFYLAPGAPDLVRVYTDIGRRIRADGLLRAGTLSAQIPPGMRYAGNLTGPPPVQQGSKLLWAVAGVPFDGLKLTFQVEPTRAGHQAALTDIELDFIDGLGRGGWVGAGEPWVTVLDPALLPTPAPSPTPRPVRPVFLPITQRGHCLLNTQHADVALVLDASRSMEEESGGRSKLAAAKAAGGLFVDLLKLPADQLALVVFNSSAEVVAPLGSDGASVHRALNGVTTAPNTRLDLAIEAATIELTGPRRRPANSPVMVLLTDGRPSGTTDATVLERAATARSAGIEIYAIGLGADVDPALLGAITASGARVFLAPGGDDLERIYRSIAVTIPCR